MSSGHGFASSDFGKVSSRPQGRDHGTQPTKESKQFGTNLKRTKAFFVGLNDNHRTDKSRYVSLLNIDHYSKHYHSFV